jgi:protocatechuate 3,4-dioxygenase beta subunit
MRRVYCSLCAWLALAAADLHAAAPAQAEAAYSIRVAPEAEPGEPLLVQGTVVDADGAPLAGATVYVYHTDVHGDYGPGGNRQPRLHGTMQTDKRGRYEFRTIRPGAYPAGGVPAHIHYVVTAPGHAQRVFEIVFEGDPYLTDGIRANARRTDGMYALVAPAPDAQGTLQCRQDVRLKRP